MKLYGCPHGFAPGVVSVPQTACCSLDLCLLCELSWHHLLSALRPFPPLPPFSLSLSLSFCLSFFLSRCSLASGYSPASQGVPLAVVSQKNNDVTAGVWKASPSVLSGKCITACLFPLSAHDLLCGDIINVGFVSNVFMSKKSWGQCWSSLHKCKNSSCV